MAIITYTHDVEEPWEGEWISCTCTICQTVFEADTDDFDLDEEEIILKCPKCNHIAPLAVKAHSN